MSNVFYKRFLLNNLQKWLNRPEIIVITGPRQVGKTFLARNILPTITNRKIQYYNFEDFELRDLANDNPKRFLESVLKEPSIYIFDEFQKVPHFTSALKIKYDNNKNTIPKIILTGSSSLYIQEKISQSLTGQAICFELYSLSFLERYSLEQINFLDDLKKVDIEDLEASLYLQKRKLQQLFEKHLLIGGYPELGELYSDSNDSYSLEHAIENLSDDLIWTKIKSIVQTILEKDLLNLIKSEYLFPAKKLLEILAYRIGNLISIENLASDLQLNVKTIRNLIANLEGLFFIEFLYPKANLGNEYKKAAKVYFHDLGIRNGLINLHRLPIDNTQMGGLVENFIFSQLKRYCIYGKEYKINYWRNYNRNEVDFVLTSDNEIISIEVKYQRTQKDKITKGIVNFIERYQPQSHIIVTYNYFGIREYKNCQIYFIPAYVFGLLI